MKLKTLIDSGHIIFDDCGEAITGVVLSDDEFLVKYGEDMAGMMYENTTDMDHGAYTKISDFNKQFENWKVCKVVRVKI